MWPWGHLAFGYVLYSLGVRARFRRAPEAWNALALGLGTQFPDLVDKPFAWWIPILPGGRTLGHSLVFAVPLVAVLALFAHRYGGIPEVVAFGFGYATHLVGDIVEPLLYGSAYELSFLLWPLTPTVVYESEPSVVWHLQAISLTPVFLVELALGVLVGLLWLFDLRAMFARRSVGDPDRSRSDRP